MEARNTPEHSSRWGSNATFRFVVLVSMLNEAAVVFAAAEISHSTYYAFALWHLATVIFVGMPVVYSQLAITQYTNCDIISFWDYFPIFRGFGYGSIFIILLKNIYLNVVTSWYLEYAFYAALDPPPWFSCDYFNTSKCMVKRVNVSVFQHCIEAETMYSDDCGMSTASYWLYEIEIGGNNTKDYPSSCFYPWRPLVGAVCLNVMIFVLSLKRERFFLVFAKLIVVYLCGVTLTLLVVALTAPGGGRRAGRVGAGGGAPADFTLERGARGLQRALLALGPGSALLVFISRDAPFRAPAAMTAIATALCSTLVCVLLAFIVYTGLEAMVFFHGEADNIIEIGDSYVFLPFASVSEIMCYFNGQPIWGLLWFSMVFLCLLINLWLDYVFLFDVIKTRLSVVRRYTTLCRFIVKVGIYFMSWPFYCIDLNGTLSDALSVLELTAAFFFSLSFYWIYGYKTHATDITFMIGIKPSLFWKTTWCVNPLILLFCLYSKWSTLDVVNYSDSYQPRNIDLPVDVILLLVLVSIYITIVLSGLVHALVYYHRKGDIRKAFMPTESWGPVDVILFKSRAMFVPKLMTREFLYRQVRIRGYKSRKQNSHADDEEETGQVEQVHAKRANTTKISRHGE